MRKRRRGSGEKDGQKGRERGGEICISGKVQWTGVNEKLKRNIGEGKRRVKGGENAGKEAEREAGKEAGRKSIIIIKN